MKDILAGLGVFVFLVGCYLLARLAFAAPEDVTFFRFWGAFGVVVLGSVIFCAADPFFGKI